MEINLKLHTILLSVGVSGAGKTYFFNEILIPQVKKKYPKIKVTYISSDDIRRELLDRPFESKYHNDMMKVSKGAFDLLEQKVRSYTEFPTNHELIIVDTTGISNDFRENIVNIAKNNHYYVDLMVFDFKNKNEYFENGYTNPEVVHKQLKRLKWNKGEFSHNKYHQVHNITNKTSFKRKFIQKLNGKFPVEITIDNYNEYFSHFLPEDKNYTIITDIHGCYEELKSLILKRRGFTIDENDNLTVPEEESLIINGDFIDKGTYGGIENTINFLYKNRDKFYLVLGNHENFVYKYIRGQVNSNFTKEFIQEHFSTIELLLTKPYLVERFTTLVEQSKIWYRKGYDFFVCHSPCEPKFITKDVVLNLFKGNGKRAGTFNSYKMMLNNRYPRKEDNQTMKEYELTLNKYFSWVKDYQRNFPYLIFGHVALRQKLLYNNIVFGDTGCVNGNKLSSFTIVGDKIFTSQVPSKQEKKKELPTLFDVLIGDKNYNELQGKEKSRVDWLVKNKVNFISSTVSPCNSYDGKLESLEWGIDYYNGKTDKVIIQPKYMGSRANIYLASNNEDSYIITRNGFKWKGLEENKEEIYPIFDSLRKRIFDDETEMVILDAELLPWKLLGSGMIDNTFYTYGKSFENLQELFENTDILTHVKNIKSSQEYENWLVDKNELNKKQLYKKYGEQTCRTFDTIKTISINQDLEIRKKQIEIYKEQLKLYAEDGNIEIKPFSILKIIKKDGSEILTNNMSNIDIFSTITDDDYMVIDYNDPLSSFYVNGGKTIYKPDNVSIIDFAENFFHILTQNKKMEGVVIKPEIVYNENIAPMLKCRNENYLTIVYGIDYKDRYEEHIQKKFIKNKLKLSMEEFKIGMDMLEVNREKITQDNTYYKDIATKLISEIKKESNLDPRL